MSVKHLEANSVGRDFVVGDLHGQISMFFDLLRSAKFNFWRDRVFSVGDLIDRGPDSIGCLSLLGNHWFHAVRGNHEDMLIRTAAGRPTKWTSRSGSWWLSVPHQQQLDLNSECMAMPYIIVVGSGADRFNVLHAEWFGNDEHIDSGNFSADDIHSLLWGRTRISGEKSGFVAGLSPTYVGHTIVEQITRLDNHIYVDTGAGYPGCKMSMIEPATGQIFSINYGGKYEK